MIRAIRSLFKTGRRGRTSPELVDKFSEIARKCLVYARNEVVRLRHKQLDVMHILLAFLRGQEPQVCQLLQQLAIEREEIAKGLVNNG